MDELSITDMYMCLSAASSADTVFGKPKFQNPNTKFEI